jgi:hypothetical protein
VMFSVGFMSYNKELLKTITWAANGGS